MADETEAQQEAEPDQQAGRVIPYAPYPLYVELGTATALSGSYVVMEFQDQGGDRTYFMNPEYCVRLFPKALKLARGLMIAEAQSAKLVGPDGKALIK